MISAVRRSAIIGRRRPTNFLTKLRLIAANKSHRPGRPFSSCEPRSANFRPAPATRSVTTLETRTSPGAQTHCRRGLRIRSGGGASRVWGRVSRRLGRFRITREAIDAVTAWGRSELPPEPGVVYSAFCDPSGGVRDAMTLAVAHLREIARSRGWVDAILSGHGTVTRSVALLGSTGKMAYDLVCAPSVPPCDHPARCLSLYSLHTQLSRRRRSARRARSGCLVRDGATGLKIRAGVRSRASPSTPAADVAMAPR